MSLYGTYFYRNIPVYKNKVVLFRKSKQLTYFFIIMDPSITYCCISWDLHKNYISTGFSHLQKNEEFVDMTIAAEGHLVKVHKNIIALASPYIKDMLHSASCSHPVVFLNNVRHKVLSYILEYIYTGEVKVPYGDINEFIDTSKALSIKGVENVLPVNISSEVLSPDDAYYDNIELEDNNDVHEEKLNAAINSKCAAHITINRSNYEVNIHKDTNQENQYNLKSENSGLPNNLMEVCVEDIPSQSTIDYNITSLSVNRNNACQLIEQDSYDINNCASFVNDEPETLNIKDKVSPDRNTPFIKSIAIKGGIEMKDIIPQYTISNRGALQLILNRYMYLCHHHSNGGRKRRWRCIDYRRMQCPAIVDTMDENVTNRIGLHSHGFHDIKILKKFRKNCVFTTISKAKETKNNDKEESDEDVIKNNIVNK